MTQTDELIETLAAQLTPVQRMRAPALRALGWLTTVGAVSLVVILRYANLLAYLHRMEVPRVAMENIGSSLTAITAVIAAFQLSVPGRSPRWAWLPLPTFLLWLAASGMGCLANGLGLAQAQGSRGESVGCFAFIAGVSVPLAIGLFWMLRRSRPIAPMPVAVFGTLGIAATAATVLQFFHPFDVTVIDLAFHLAAIGFVMLIGTLLRRTLLAAQ